jgi:hypothetical protein
VAIRYASNIANSTQHLLAAAGHNYAEPGVSEELYAVLTGWLAGGGAAATARRRTNWSRL